MKQLVSDENSETDTRWLDLSKLTEKNEKRLEFMTREDRARFANENVEPLSVDTCYEYLKLLRPNHGCVPDEYIGDSLELAIVEKFRSYWTLVRSYLTFAFGIGEGMRVCIEPSIDSTCGIVLYDSVRHVLLLVRYEKAWNFSFDDAKELIDSVVLDAKDIQEEYLELGREY